MSDAVAILTRRLSRSLLSCQQLVQLVIREGLVVVMIQVNLQCLRIDMELTLTYVPFVLKV